MVKRLVLIIVIFGCVNAAPQEGATEATETIPKPSEFPIAGGWNNISTDDEVLIGLIVRSINFINNQLQLNPALQ